MTRSRAVALLLIAAITTVMLVSCGSDNQGIDGPGESRPTTQEAEPTPTPTPGEAITTSEPAAAPEPTAAPTPTPEPTAAPTPTPELTAAPTPTPTPTPAPTPTPTPTPTPKPIHVHSFKGGNCSTPSTCECGEAGAYGDHNWTTKENGHYEQVQTGSKTIKEWGPVTIYGCRACDFTTYSWDELNEHQPAILDKSKPCSGVGWWSTTTTEVIGTHEEPVYKDQWVVDAPTTICSICGATK